MTAERKASTAAVLDQMVAGIMGAKSEKSARLTPVGTETAKMPGDLPGVYMAREGVQDIAKDLRKQAEFLLNVADALDKHTGESSVKTDPKTDAIEATKREEREADARAAAEPTFAEKFAAMQKEAQDATFTPVNPVVEIALADMDEHSTPEGWLCPAHGDQDLRDRTSPKGREYRDCGVPNCKEFQR